MCYRKLTRVDNVAYKRSQRKPSTPHHQHAVRLVTFKSRDVFECCETLYKQDELRAEVLERCLNQYQGEEDERVRALKLKAHIQELLEYTRKDYAVLFHHVERECRHNAGPRLWRPLPLHGGPRPRPSRLVFVFLLRALLFSFSNSLSLSLSLSLFSLSLSISLSPLPSPLSIPLR